MKISIANYFSKLQGIAPLVFFRIVFGLLMTWSSIRFISKGWVEDRYITPTFFFKYYGFHWIESWGEYTYILFGIQLISAICITLGYRYRLASILFFLSFTYIELIDRTTYLNHYYFISIVSFILIFLPANNSFSIDVLKNRVKAYSHINRWQIDILKVLITIVYFYATVAKLNSDWLFDAMPLKSWLVESSNAPYLQHLFIRYSWLSYLMSWFGIIYDFIIPFLLWYPLTRTYGFVLVVVFHSLTALFFDIGIFPWIMISVTSIFFPPEFYQKGKHLIFKKLKIPSHNIQYKKQKFTWGFPEQIKLFFLGGFMIFQLLFPLRFLLYSGNVLWTEQGFSFSWRVMVMKKEGYCQFKVVNNEALNKKEIYIDNSIYLTDFQEQQMRTQADFILQFAQHLADVYRKKGFNSPQVFVESFVSLNGRASQRFISEKLDLATQVDNLANKSWILPLKR